jgi:D-arabinose 1-dehydrogenase-like Zn-dependent alcohol dehydrogenase
LNRIEWSDVELEAQPRTGEVRLRSVVSLISAGTEIRLYTGEPMADRVWEAHSDLSLTTVCFGPEPAYRVSEPNRLGRPRFPVAFGYNNVAEVVQLGSGSGRVAVGDLVMTVGHHQELFDVREWECVPVPRGVDAEEAVFSYIASLGLHALRRAGFQLGENVAVVGLGVVGLCAALVADGVGARLACLEVDPDRRAHAANALPSTVVLSPNAPDSFQILNEQFEPEGIDIVLEAAGGPAALDMGMRVVDRRGRVVSLALQTAELGHLLAGGFYEKEISLIGTAHDSYLDPRTRSQRFSMLRDVVYVLDLQRRGRISLGKARSETFDVSEIDQAYRVLASGERRDLIGVLLRWPGQCRKR